MTELAKPPARGREPDNLHEYTVSELAGSLKRTVEGRFGRVRLRGEVSGFMCAASGHLYFDLKDSGAKIASVCWRWTAGRLRVRPEDGAEVIVTGSLTTYAPRSQYQVVIDTVELAGEGALLKLLEERRKKLAREGLFDDDRKQYLPYLPENIGVVTSPSGAVLRDILHRLRDRFPRRVLVWPVPVQGQEAAPAITSAIAGFNALSATGAVPRPDVLIVARGGGSVEDLWAFNEESVVRAAAASEIPLISAVGHETDTTLLDFAADVRAPTPTAAAEMSVPVRADLVAEMASLQARLVVAINRAFEHRRGQIQGFIRGLRGPRELLERGMQRLDHAAERLVHANDNAFRNWLHVLELAGGRLMPKLLAAGLEQGLRRVSDAGGRLSKDLRHVLTEHRRHLRSLDDLLESVSHKRVLARGYALLRDGAARPVTSAHLVTPGMALDIELTDGHVLATAEKGNVASQPGTRGKPHRKPKPIDKSAEEGNLL